jgi:protein-L-isoaspartate(D-aspartate) O-methyltransferase
MIAAHDDAAHERMVQGLGRLPPRVAAALRAVPRSAFAPVAWRSLAYADEPIPLDGTRATISAPSMVALHLEWADIPPGGRILEIGSGSGYVLALLRELVGESGTVVGVEIDPRLAEESRATLQSLGYGGKLLIVTGDGHSEGFDLAPFDRILVSCATPILEEHWKTLVAPGGTIVAPVGDAEFQTLERWSRDATGEHLRKGPLCRFVAIRSVRSSVI